VDGDPFAGYENVIYAADRRTIFVAYKRFLRSPNDPGGDIVPAELRVAKSVDGGQTWDVRTLDGEAPEQGDSVQQSVAIDGDGADAVYVSYLVETPTRSLLRLARSHDGGDTWTLSTLAVGGGEYEQLEVVDANTALLATAAGGGSGSTLRLLLTTDGGAHWSDSEVDAGADWYIGLDRTSAGRIWLSFYDGGPTDLHTASSGSPTGPWKERRIAGNGNDPFFTGLFSSVAISNGEVFVAYEDFQPSRGRSVVRYMRSNDGGQTWQRTDVDSAWAIGWTTRIHVLRSPAQQRTDVFLSYWFERTMPVFHGRARVAHSSDGGATWQVWSVPDDDHVQPYIESAVPARNLQYVSYLVQDLETGDRVLRVARLHLGAAA
jgi:hypothetical protein